MRSVPRYLTAEVKDIIVSVAVMTAGFFILMYLRKAFSGNVAVILGVSFLAVLTAFLLHEMAHRYIARRYGGIAFFRMWLPGIALILITSFIGIIFALPGAVNIGGVYRKDQIGRTAFAGPLTNISIGTALFLVSQGIIFLHGPLLAYEIAFFVGALNLWFGLFNMIPFPPFDGEKVYHWDKYVYIVAVAFALVMNVVTGFL